MSQKAKHVVYKKDATGSTFAVAEGIFQNEIFQFDVNFPNADKILQDLPNFKRRPDDVWIIDYMKSGTHWSYEIINLLTRDVVTRPLFDKLEHFLEMAPDLEHFDKFESPRILNSHVHLKHMSKHIIDNSKIVFLLRNPKSVAVSGYYHYYNISTYEYSGTFEGFLPVFTKSKIDDLFGNWFEMVLPYWEYLKGRSNVLFMTYEDLLREPVKHIRQISDFLDLGHDDPFCEHVAKEAGFEAMKKRELEEVANVTFLKGQDGFIRKGIATDWKCHFTVAQNEMFDAVYEEKMKDFPDLKAKIQFS